jgi:hypothetical protein
MAMQSCLSGGATKPGRWPSREQTLRARCPALGIFRAPIPPEVLHFHDLSPALIDASQFVQGVVQSQEFGSTLPTDAILREIRLRGNGERVKIV